MSDDDPAPGGSDPTPAPITGTPGLEVTKTDDTSALSTPPAVGNVLGYTITVQNIGNVTLSAVTPVDTLTDAAGSPQTLNARPPLSRGTTAMPCWTWAKPGPTAPKSP